MVLINFTEADQNQKITLPTSEIVKPPDKPFEHPIFLNLEPDGTILFGTEELTMTALRTRMGREITFLRYKDRTPGDATVIIRGDGNARAGDVREIMKICQELKFDHFALRAKEDVQ